jgi:PAS domain S-box-containing protein
MKGENKTKLQRVNDSDTMIELLQESESGGHYDKPVEQRGDSPDKEMLRFEGSLDDLELSSVIDVPSIHSLMDSFQKFAGIPLAIVDLKGRVLAGPGWGEICRRFHRMHPETCRNCIESDIELSSGIPEGKYRLYRCKNNMWEIATPIVVAGRHMANIISGQFFFDDTPPDEELFRLQARKYGFPEEEYLAALDAAPRFSRKSVDAGMAFLMKLARMFSQLSFNNMNLKRLAADRNTLVDSLRTAEEKYRGIFENAIEGIYRTSPDGRFLEANPAMARILGYDSPSALMSRVTDVGTQLYADPGGRTEFVSLLDQQNYASFETQMRRRDGSLRWIYLRGRTVRGAEGKIRYYEGFAEDVTERKSAEETLKQYSSHLEALVKERTFQLEERNRQLNLEIAERKRVEEIVCESENKYHTIFENTGTATLIVEDDTTISLANKEVERLFHYTRDELEGKKSWKDFKLQEDIEQLMEYHRLRRVNPEAAPKNYEMKVIDRFGSLRDVYVTVAMIPGTSKSVVSLLEITHLKNMERALTKSEALYRNLFENASIGMFQISPEGGFLRCNKAFSEMLGYESPEEVVSSVFNTATNLHTTPENRDLILSTLEEREWFYGEIPHIRKDGSIMIGKMAIRRMLNSDGTIAYLEGIAEDITEKKKVEEQLKRYAEEITDLYENAPCGYHSLAEDGTYLRVNRTELSWLGYSREEMVGKMKFSDLLSAEEKALFMTKFSDFKKRGWARDHEYTVIRKDGSRLPVLINATAVSDENGRYLMSRGSLFDNSDRKHAEEALLEREKELRVKAQNLQEVNTTLNVLLDTIGKDTEELKERVTTNIREQVLPYLEQLKKTPLDEVQRGFLQIAENRLDEIASPFVKKLTSRYLNLTKREIQIATLIKDGKTTKEIAEILDAKKRAIDFHRENIRKKLGLKNKKSNLQILLRSFS